MSYCWQVTKKDSQVKAELTKKGKEICEPQLRPYCYPKLVGVSLLLPSLPMWDALYQHLPLSCCLKRTVLLFCSREHGYSLRTLLGKVKNQVFLFLSSVSLLCIESPVDSSAFYLTHNSQRPLILLFRAFGSPVTFGAFLSEELLPSKSFKGDQRCFLFRCNSSDPKEMYLNESEILQRRERTRNYVSHSALDSHSKPPLPSDSLFDSNSSEYQSRNASKLLSPPILHHSHSTPSPSHTPHTHTHTTPHPPTPSPLSPSHTLSSTASSSQTPQSLGNDASTPSSFLSPNRDSYTLARRVRGLPNLEFEAFHWKPGNQRRFQLVDSSGLHFGSALWIGSLSLSFSFFQILLHFFLFIFVSVIYLPL